jgi:hypothetical protein
MAYIWKASSVEARSLSSGSFQMESSSVGMMHHVCLRYLNDTITTKVNSILYPCYQTWISIRHFGKLKFSLPRRECHSHLSDWQKNLKSHDHLSTKHITSLLLHLDATSLRRRLNNHELVMHLLPQHVIVQLGSLDACLHSANSAQSKEY